MMRKVGKGDSSVTGPIVDLSKKKDKKDKLSDKEDKKGSK